MPNIVPPELERLLRHGLYVLPVSGKTPILKRWPELSSAEPTMIAEWIGRYPGCNFGVDTGKSRILVIDVDGPDALTAWKATGHTLPRSLTIQTGRGYHVYLRDPDGRGRSTQSILAARVDTKAQGGQVVAPPSTHANGSVYKILRDHPIAPAPEALLALLAWPPPAHSRPPLAATYAPRVCADGMTPYGANRLRGQLHALRGTPKGNRNSMTRWAAQRAGELCATGHVPHSARDLVVAVALDTGLCEREVAKAVRSGWEWGQARPDPTIRPVSHGGGDLAVRTIPPVQAARLLGLNHKEGNL